MSEFQSILEKLVGQQMLPPLLAKVTAVDDTAMTVDCNPIAGGAPIIGCRLRPVADGSGLGVVTIPKVGALTLLLPINNAEALALAFSEFASIRVIGDGLRIEAKSTGEVTVHGDVVVEGKVIVGSQQGAEPMLKGDKVGDRFAEIYAHIGAIHNALAAMAVAGAAACIGPMAPLAPSFSALGAAVAAELPTTAADQMKFPLCKSNKCQTA